MVDQKYEEQIWDSFWYKRKKTFIGNIVFYMRERFLAKSFVKVAMDCGQRGVVLEAGCGTALSSILLRKERGDNIVALDFSLEALTTANELAQKYNEHIEVVRGDIRSLPFSDKSVNFIWNIGTLEHFEDPQDVLREMMRVSNVYICIVPSKSIVWTIYEIMIGLLGIGEQGYMKLYTPEDLKLVLKEAGYNSVRIERINSLTIFPYIAAVGITKE